MIVNSNNEVFLGNFNTRDNVWKPKHLESLKTIRLEDNATTISGNPLPDYIKKVMIHKDEFLAYDRIVRKRMCEQPRSFKQVSKLVIGKEACSISELQRQFNLSYNTANTYMNILTNLGLVEVPDENGIRKVLNHNYNDFVEKFSRGWELTFRRDVKDKLSGKQTSLFI